MNGENDDSHEHPPQSGFDTEADAEHLQVENASAEAPGLSDGDQTRKDVSYAPSSGRETEVVQDDQDAPHGVGGTQVKLLPGTGRRGGHRR